jgi:tetratricopeptide (TPR) repeat protein
MRKKECFVIMPISATAEHDEKHWTNLYEVIERALEKLDYDCVRSEAGPKPIIDGIIKDIFEKDLVIAVLTDHNANVWYELGIRHTLRNGTIMIIEEGQDLPFDIRAYGVIFHPSDLFATQKKLENEIPKFLNKMEEGIHDDNPVQNYFSKDKIKIARQKISKDTCSNITSCNLRFIAEDNFRKGEQERNRGYNKTALSYYEKALKNYQDLNDYFNQANTLFCMSIVEKILKTDSLSTREYFDLACALYDKAGRKSDIGIYKKMGAFLSRNGMYEAGRIRYSEAEAICEEQQDNKNLADILRLRGIMEGKPKLKNPQKGRDFLERAREMYIKIDDVRGQALVA